MRALLIVLLLVGCAGQNMKPTASQLIRSCFQAVTTAREEATTLLQQKLISIERACQVSEYAKVAYAGCQAARTSWITGKPPSTVEDYVQAALLAVDGLTKEAAERGKWSCERQEFQP